MASIVIIPAFNEEANITPLIQKILSLSELSLDVLVVDDHSTDQTAQAVGALVEKTPRVKLLSNQYPEHGLANGYKTGFVYALAQGYEWIVCMDGDFSHDPSEISRFFSCQDKADWVVGSRYVSQGSAQGLKPFRLFISRAANMVVRMKTGSLIQDMTGGFNCIHCRVLQKVDFLSIESRNFIFQVELKMLALRAGFRLAEAPIIFYARRTGESKFSSKVAWEALKRILRLRHLPRRFPEG
jgi:dolichol-phosphate mannosyltransferase